MVAVEEEGIITRTATRDATMAKLVYLAHRLWVDRRGQDMIEYSLLAAALAVVVAGFLPPTIMPAITVIFSKVVSGFNAS
jgi:Flp pilus assembly pilin Flp